MILTLAFCLFVYELWAGYDALLGQGAPRLWWRAAVQAAGLAGYTAVITPLVWPLLGRMQRLVISAPPGRGRR
jgi:hypothetical protein